MSYPRREEIEEKKRTYDAMRDGILSNPEGMMLSYLPKDTISSIRPQEPNPNSSITLTTLPHSPQPPDPPDSRRSQQKSSTKKVSRLQYSCDEIYERMENGLCIFCEEQDTPGHQQLKHKGFRTFMVECDDNQVSDDSESVESVLELPSVVLLPNEETTGSVIGSEAATIETSPLTHLSLYKVGFEAELLCSKELGKTDLSTQDKESSGVKSIIVTDSIENEEPSLEKDFKADDSMRSNKTLNLEDDEHTQTEVMKLVLSWNNRVWEPGGVFIVHDEWKWLKKNRVNGVNAKFRSVICLNDVWKLLICLGAQNSDHRSFEIESLYTKALVETVSSIQEIKLNGVMSVRAAYMVQNKEANQEKEVRLHQVPSQTDSFSYPQVPFSELEQRRNNRLHLHTVMVLNEFQVGNGFDVWLTPKELVHFKEINSHSSDANHIWEPGGLQTQWDWLRRVNSTVLKISQGFQRVDLKEILCTIMKFQKEIFDDVLSLKKTQELFSLAEWETQNWIVNEERKVQLCSCLDIVAWILLGTYSCEYKKLMRLPVYQLLEVQAFISPGHKRKILRYVSLEISRNACQVWHRWKIKNEIWLAVSGLPLLLLARFLLNTRDYICYSSWSSKSWHVSTENDMSILTFNGFENVKWQDSVKQLPDSYALIRGSVSFARILHLANTHALFHSPRPPELFLCEVGRLLSHMTRLLVQVSSIYSSLRTRMFSTGEYCYRKKTCHHPVCSGYLISMLHFDYLWFTSIGTVNNM